MEQDLDALNARIDAMQLLLQTILTGADAAQRDLVRQGFESNMTRWRELLIMSKCSDRYLAALEAEHLSWLKRFEAGNRDATLQPPVSRR